MFNYVQFYYSQKSRVLILSLFFFFMVLTFSFTPGILKTESTQDGTQPLGVLRMTSPFFSVTTIYIYLFDLLIIQ